jgi:hypothetical protein
MTAIPATQEVEVGGSLSETILDKVSVRPYLTNKLKSKGLGAWLRCYTLGHEFNPQNHQNNNNNNNNNESFSGLQIGILCIFFSLIN